MDGYPRRDPYYAHRLVRLLFKTCAAMELGQNAMLLVIHIAHTEDASRYKGPVRFWNSQLLDTCGFGSTSQLRRARDRAVEFGWLEYHREHDRSVGYYFTRIPDRFKDISDSPIEPAASVSASPVEQEMEQKTAHEVTQETMRERFQDVSGSPVEQEMAQECAAKRRRNAPRNGAPSNPIPIPNPNKKENHFSSLSVRPPRLSTKEMLDRAGVPADADFSKMGDD